MNIIFDKVHKDDALYRFELMFPTYYKDIVNYKYIGDWETVFTLSDNSKVIFDEFHETIKIIKPRTKNNLDLSEQEWREEFSRKLKRKMEFRGITQKEFAADIGISVHTMCNYTTGKSTPSAHVVAKMASIFRCSISELTDFSYLL